MNRKIGLDFLLCNASQRPASAYLACVRLVLHAFCGLLPRRLETDSDINALAALIQILPSYGERAVLWADLCMRCALCARQDLTEKLAQEFLMPALHLISREDSAYLTRVLIQVAPALYRAQPATCLEEIAGLDVDSRDVALRHIVRFLLARRVPSDPVEPTPNSSAQTTY